VLAFIWYVFPISFIKFTTAPDHVAVLIDNDKHLIKSGDTVNIAPGKHTVTIFEDDYNPYEQQITVANRSTYDFTIGLIGLSDKTRDIVSNPKYSGVYEKMDSKLQSTIDNLTFDKYPVIDILPIEARYYTISACKSEKYPNDPLAEAICIDVNPPIANSGWDYKSDALENLKSHTFYSIDNYEIIWKVTLPDGTIVQ
jgi:hypothetical protein